MEKTRKIRTLNLLALIVAVLGLTVAFATLSSTLTINGTASVDAASWDVRFIDLGEAQIGGDAKEISTPSISADGTKIEGINVSLTKPGDTIVYNFNVINNGTINAKLNNLKINGLADGTPDDKFNAKMFPKCDWNGDGSTTDEEREYCRENIEYIPSIVFQVGDVIEPGKTLASYNEIFPKEYSFCIIQYNSDAESLPKGEVEIKLDFEMEFIQAQ